MYGRGCLFVKAETRCMMYIESLHSIFVNECSDSEHMPVNILFGISRCAPTQVSFEVVTIVQCTFRHCGRRRCVVGCVTPDVSTYVVSLSSVVKISMLRPHAAERSVTIHPTAQSHLRTSESSIT